MQWKKKRIFFKESVNFFDTDFIKPFKLINVRVRIRNKKND